MSDLKSERKRLRGRNAAPPLWSQVDQPTQSTWFYHTINLISPANQAYFWREGPMKASRFHLRFTRLIFSWLWWRISWISSFTRLTLVSLQCIYKQYFPVKLHRKHLLGRQCFRFHGERSPILTDERVEDSFVRRICSFVLWKCYFFTLKCWFFTLKSAIQERIKGENGHLSSGFRHAFCIRERILLYWFFIGYTAGGGRLVSWTVYGSSPFCTKWHRARYKIIHALRLLRILGNSFKNYWCPIKF